MLAAKVGALCRYEFDRFTRWQIEKRAEWVKHSGTASGGWVPSEKALSELDRFSTAARVFLKHPDWRDAQARYKTLEAEKQQSIRSRGIGVAFGFAGVIGFGLYMLLVHLDIAEKITGVLPFAAAGLGFAAAEHFYARKETIQTSLAELEKLRDADIEDWKEGIS